MARGREDVRRVRFWRAVMSEFVGSMFVVAIGCGTWTVGPAAPSPTEDIQPLIQHQLSIVKVSLAFGLTYAGVIYCSRSVGDAHINPGVTVALLATRRVSFARGTLYVVAQLFGAVLGAILAFLITFGETTYPSAGVVAPGCTALAPKVSESQGFSVEFLTSFFFVFVVFACHDNRKSSSTAMRGDEDAACDGAVVAGTCKTARVRRSEEREEAFVIGLVYTGLSLFAIPYTGGSINAARSFGPALVNNVWTSHWIYWFGPILGAICGGATYDVIFSTRSSFRRVRTCLLVFHHPGDSQMLDLPADVDGYTYTGRHGQQQQHSMPPPARSGRDQLHKKITGTNADSSNAKRTWFDNGFGENNDIYENEEEEEYNEIENDDKENNRYEDKRRNMTSPKIPRSVTSQVTTGCMTVVSDGNIRSTCLRSGESAL